MYNLNEMTVEARVFGERLLVELDRNNLLGEFEFIDHICFRTETIASYEKSKEEIALNSKLISEAYINGRPISTFKLNNPIKINSQYSIGLLELPAPKCGQYVKEGFDHIEVVSKSRLENILGKFTKLKFVTENISAKINREISILFNEGLVKFHESSLEDVIHSEKKQIIKNNSKNLVFIDFDETLVSSKEQFIEASLTAISDHLKINIDRSEFNKKLMPTFPELFKNWGIDSNDEIKMVIDCFQEKSKDLEDMIFIPSGIESIMSCLHHEGVEIIVWTARDKGSTESFISKSPLKKYISKIIGFDCAESSKPKLSNEMLFSSKNKNLIVIGDSYSDRDGAKNINAKFFQACWLKKSELGIDKKGICDTPFEFLDKAIHHFRSSTF
jgi:predicted metalloenzyme YecM/phosphoglycolate phosphatase-like HAD superfamily hydrolase